MLSKIYRKSNRFCESNHIKRFFSVTQLQPNDDTFLLLQHKSKNIYLVGNTYIPNVTPQRIFDTISTIKPDTVLLQICQHRADILQKLSMEHGEDLNESICYEAALTDFTNEYPLSSGIFAKSKTVIKPYELFGLLFGYEHYRAMYASLLCQSSILYADDNMKQCIKTFEKKLEKMYDPSGFLNQDNMFEKDLAMADIERELAMNPNMSPKDAQKHFMKQLMQRMLSGRGGKQKKDPEQKQKQKDVKKLHINQQLEIELADTPSNEIDWSTIYTRYNSRLLIDELKDTMKPVVDTLIDQRNENICNTLMNCDGENIVAFVNFSNIDGIEERWIHLS